MDKMLYISMSGLKQIMQAQARNSHNLANVSTTGFKADLLSFRDVPVYGSGYASRSYSVASDNGVDLSVGGIISTKNDLDVAIKGKGFFVVQSPDGGEAYTRAGSMHTTQNGQLVNGAGYPVLGDGGAITIPPASKIEIGADGTISIVTKGQDSTSLAVIDRIKLVNPDTKDLIKNSNGLLVLKNGESAPVDAKVRVVSGFLETSNVNVIDAMVNMIELARNYEMQSKMMKKAEENDSVSSRLLRNR